jgi:hypothetical protein
MLAGQGLRAALRGIPPARAGKGSTVEYGLQIGQKITA